MELETDLSILGSSYDILIDKPYAIAYFFPDTKIGFVQWRKHASFDEYKGVFEAVLERHKKTPGQYFLSDIREQGASSKEKKDWFKEVALREAIDGGLEKAAVIMGTNPFKQFYINTIMNAINTMDLPFKAFDNIAEAKEWLVT